MLGNDRGGEALWPALASDFRISVDYHFSQIREQLGGAVAARREAEQLEMFVEKRGGYVACLKLLVVDHVLKKRNVGLNAADAKFAESAVHALAGLVELAGHGRAFP